MTTAKTADLDAIEADANERLGQLRAQRLTLAPEALADDEMAAELADIESEILAAERELERVGLARAETGRRVAEVAASAEDAARLASIDAAEQIDGERLAAARAFDSAARNMAAAWDDMTALTVRESQVLRSAGVRSPLRAPGSRQVVWALCAAGLDARRVFDVMVEPVGRGSGQPPALVDTVARVDFGRVRHPELTLVQVPHEPQPAPLHPWNAASPAEYYRQHREAGDSIEVALAEVARAYGRQPTDDYIVEMCEAGERELAAGPVAA